MSAAGISRWSRRYVLVSALALVVAHAVALLAGPRATFVYMTLLGFVFHVIFGKAYALIPTYFDRELRPTWGPPLQFPLVVAGTVGLVVGTWAGTQLITAAGAVVWAMGIAVFVGTIAWTIRDNLTGRETATGDHNADRRRVDRLSNAFVPVAILYLVLGTVALLSVEVGIVTLPLAGRPAAVHLLAAGTVVMLLLAIGFRLLPRLATAQPPEPLVPVVLVAGAVGPALLAWSFPTGRLFRLGAVLEAIAVVGFAIAVLVLIRRSNRPRVGLYTVGIGGVAGVVGVGLGVGFAVGVLPADLATAHLRLNLLGLLGLAIVGVTFQLYPPTVGNWPGCTSRTAAGVTLAFAVALSVQSLGIAAGQRGLLRVGEAVGTVGSLGFLYLYAAAVRAR